jgi:hypothetical protein
MTPEDAQAFIVEQSAMSGVQQDPETKAAQMAALQGLQDITSGGGMTAMDRQKLNQIATEEATRSRGAREAIMQQAQARGAGGSGMDILAQLQNQQESANRASSRDIDVAAMAQQRALEALQQQGQLAGQIGQQGFQQGAQRAQAQDEISKFNAQNRQQVGMSNVAARNLAQGANLSNQQQIANANVSAANQQAAQRGQVAQQQYENELRRRQGQAGIETTNVGNQFAESQGRANANNQMIGAGLAAATGLGGAYMASQASQNRQGYAKGGIIEGPDSDVDNMMAPVMSGEFVVRKEDVPDFLKKAHTDDDGEFDAAGFLDSITGHKYNYKGKK